jgi:hypothetical protein
MVFNMIQETFIDGVQETFIDGVQEIGFGRGLIRMNLASLSATERDDKNNPILELRHRVLKTPNGISH